MSVRQQLLNILKQEDINFLLTNRLPRNALTRWMGWFSKIEVPWVRTASIATWQYFSDLDLSEAKEKRFASMHACFTRELKDGARPLHKDPLSLTSPVDAIVGASGRIEGTTIFQAKGFPYTLEDLLGTAEDTSPWHNGHFVTLRLTSSMYHRFHAPFDCTVERVRYFSGDTWNVNPIALKRVEKLFCKNERVFIQTRLNGDGPLQGKPVALVPVAAILVASIRLHWLDVLFHLKYRGKDAIACDAPFQHGQEMGWFQHGSTVIVLAPPGFGLVKGLASGTPIRLGQPLMRWQGEALPGPQDQH